MSSPLNNSSAFVHSLDMFLCNLMSRLKVQDYDNQVTDGDLIFEEEEEELEYKIEDDKRRPYQDDCLQEIYLEESRIVSEIIYRILGGKSHTLKPNSGETVMIRESSIDVGFRVDEEEGEYIVWEWHGHIPRYTEDHEFSLEYIYGSCSQRILHSNLNIGSAAPRVYDA